MLNTVRLAFIGALMVLPQTTFAADKAANPCVDIAVPKDAVMARHGNWMELTPEQWQFLRGVYVLDPANPSRPALWRQGRAGANRRQTRRTGVVHRRGQSLHPDADSRRASFRDARRRDRQDQSPGNRIIGSPRRANVRIRNLCAWFHGAGHPMAGAEPRVDGSMN